MSADGSDGSDGTDGIVEFDDSPERAAAYQLMEQVNAEKDRWLKAWLPLLVDPKKAELQSVHSAALDHAIGVWSETRLVYAERVIAKFVVRYREEDGTVGFEMDLPKE